MRSRRRWPCSPCRAACRRSSRSAKPKLPLWRLRACRRARTQLAACRRSATPTSGNCAQAVCRVANSANTLGGVRCGASALRASCRPSGVKRSQPVFRSGTSQARSPRAQSLRVVSHSVYFLGLRRRPSQSFLWFAVCPSSQSCIACARSAQPWRSCCTAWVRWALAWASTSARV